MNTGSKIAAGLIVTVLLAGGVYFLAYNHEPTSVQVEVTVNSNHLILSADYVLYLNDEEVGSWSMGAGKSQTFILDVDISGSFVGRIVRIKVISSGGGLGSDMEEKHVFLSKYKESKVSLKA